jgi:hypothetical protein
MLCVKCMLTHFISVTALALVTCDLLECVNIETYSWVQLSFLGVGLLMFMHWGLMHLPSLFFLSLVYSLGNCSNVSCRLLEKMGYRLIQPPPYPC